MNNETTGRTSDELVDMDVNPDATDDASDTSCDLVPALSFALMDVDTPTELCSIPCKTRKDELRLANMRTYITNDISDLKKDGGFMVSDLYLSSQQYTAKNGDIVKGPVLYLIGPSGSFKRVTAKYFIIQVLEFAKRWQTFPWDPPVRLSAIDKINDKTNNRTYQLIISE